MRRDLFWKSFLSIGLILLAAAFILVLQFFPAAKNLVYGEQDVIRKGLDLKGGIEVILAPDYRTEDRVLIWVKNRINDEVDKIGVTQPKTGYLGLREGNKYDGLRFVFNSADEAQRVISAKLIPTDMDWEYGIEKLQLKLKAERSEAEPNVLNVRVQLDPNMYDKDALVQAKEIISRRVNNSGISETDVRLDTKNNRIQVQLPGIASQEEAEKLLKATGRLNFRLDGRIVMFGDDLKNARAEIDTERGAPVITFEFGKEGAKRFATITRNNVGKILSIYLDEEKLMDPVIQDAIPGGRGQITLGQGASLKDAKNHAILMKSGALPISLRTVQNTQVAPTLGSEMVRRSMIAGILGIVLVMIFMVIFYRVPGTMATFALIGYGFLVLGVMAVFRGVLTLPGVAGLILSIGMAVDANIIIFERIKDELRNGKRLRSALDAGFERALSAILDGNVTTLIIALVLLGFGTGPIKGFAVTLTIGILLSMFTAIVVSRTFLEMLVDRNPDKYVKHFGA